ncbi:uncharacterized protein N7482_000820, partial [Penicillium canariense]
EPSPLSSPLGPLSESPESESGFQKLSLRTDQPVRGSVDSYSSGYDPLSRVIMESVHPGWIVYASNRRVF